MSYRSDGSSNALSFGLRLGQSILIGIAAYYTSNFILNRLMDLNSNSASKMNAKKLSSILKRPDLVKIEMSSKEAELALSSVLNPDELIETFDDIGGLGDELQVRLFVY